MTLASLGATRVDDRIAELDVWRGFALLGVCIVNFVGLNSNLLSETRADSLITAGLDWRTHFLINAFLGNKAHTIFTFLFGVGIAVMASRLKSIGYSADQVLARRFLVLLVFGWVHCMFLYYGDILHIYAVLGLLMIPLSRLSDRALLAMGLLLALGGRLVYAEAEFFGFDRVTLESVPEGTIDAVSASADVSTTSITTAEFVQWNMDKCMEKAKDIARQIFVGGYYLGRVMIGFSLWRSGNIRRLLGLETRMVWAIAAVLLAASVALTVAIAVTESGDRGTLRHFLFNGTRHVSFLVLSAAYLVSLIGLIRLNALSGIASSLASVGRMSLTNYVVQSFGMMFLLFGPGLQLGGRVGALAVGLLATLFFVLQIVFSRWWLQRYSQGPLEYCWRKATYWR